MEKYVYHESELDFLERSAVPFAVYQFIDKRVVTIALSEGFFELFGYKGCPKDEIYDLMDNNMYRDTHPDDIAVISDAAYIFATEGGDYDVVYRTKKNGEYRIIHAYGRHITKENGARLAFIWYTDQGVYEDNGKNGNDSLVDVQKVELEGRNQNNKVVHDYLTGLPSMTYFYELADTGCREIRKNGNTPAIIFMDFNGMKAFNQKYGHEEGDLFLKDFSEKIIETFNHENCSRFTADHFCVFTDEANAREGALKLIDINEKLNNDKKMPLRIGIYIYDEENISIGEACDRAKMACDSEKKNYDSKIYFFEKEMMTAIEAKQYIVENIDKAISEGWIKVFYQAIVRTVNGNVCHEEALCRWIDPVKGFLSPGVFIPALEETNTIYKLDLCVLDGVIEKMKDQFARGNYVVPVSINLSRSDFYTCDIVEEVRKRVDQAGIQRNRLVIEITESTVADDLDFMIEKINAFKKLGFSVWMDDYGSGYSSPVILQKVPFDLLKIDMLFVRQLEESDKAKIVLTEIVRMAMALGLDTVAEGVENQVQADFLKDIGCTMLQGFYFSKPMPYDEILERSKQGFQIGIENPEEESYYTKLGQVNLYNLAISNNDNGQGHQDYFDTWPMVMVECVDTKISVLRMNLAFKEYIKVYFPIIAQNTEYNVADYSEKSGFYSLKAVMECAQNGKSVILDDRTIEGKIIQVLIWRIAVNPINGASAVMVAILSSTDLVSGYTAELKKSVVALLANMPAMTFSKDVITRKYLACNQAFADYAHKETPEGVVGLTDFEIFDEETAKHFIEDDKKALSMDKPYIFFEDVPDAAGNMRQFQTTKLRFTDDTGRECLLGLCQDVTDAMRIKREYIEKLEEVHNQALIDSLTGMKNKKAYQEKEDIFNRRIIEKRQTEFAITVLDVNNLKEVNDTQGHEAGDKCICEAGKIICQIFKRSPVYRIGGDEFVVVSQDEDYEGIDDLIDIVEAHNKDALFNGGIVIACGMAKYNENEDASVSTVFTHADKKMYENKTRLKKQQQSS